MSAPRTPPVSMHFRKYKRVPTTTLFLSVPASVYDVYIRRTVLFFNPLAHFSPAPKKSYAVLKNLKQPYHPRDDKTDSQPAEVLPR